MSGEELFFKKDVVKVKLTFHGATEGITGSACLLATWAEADCWNAACTLYQACVTDGLFYMPGKKQA